MPLTRKRFLGLAGRGALGAAAYSTFGFLDGCVAGSSADGKPCPAGTKLSVEPFKYRGKAIGVSGEITDPRHGRIPDQAVATLDERGGHREARTEGFGFEGIFYVGDAFSLVTGTPDLKACKPVFRSVVTSTVRGLDVDGVVRADSIVANLESQQPEPEGRELEMLPVGYFSNLRIRGYLIDLQPKRDYLATPMTRSRKSELDKELPPEVQRVDKELEAEIARERGPRCQHPYPTGLGGEKYECSIFNDRAIRAAVRGIPGVMACKGGRIHVEDLGDIFLGQFVVEKHLRQLTMLRIVLASPPSGDVRFASVEGDGVRG